MPRLCDLPRDRMRGRTLCLVFALLAGLSPSLRAEPQPAKLQALLLETGETDGSFSLAGRDATRQLLVTGRYTDGQRHDLTRAVRYEATPVGVVRLDTAGVVTPLKEGQATVRVTEPGGLSAVATVTVTHLVRDRRVSFANEVVPIFTRFGCNAGGCHGKADGQNGFKLSLLGFEPAEDYEYLVKEARGRRLYPWAPDQSLLLRKATGAAAHGGGKKLAPDSQEYRILRRWIEQGAPPGNSDDATVTRLEVLPGERLLERDGEQQLVALAHLSDGTTVDVTRLAQFESNQLELAQVSPTGLVRVKQVPGSAAVMARYQSSVAVFRATIPLGTPLGKLPAAKNFVDELVFKRLAELGLPPSELCDDATFLRRVTLDLCGRLPTLDEVTAFLADRTNDRCEKLVDRLLESKEYADYFANKWSSILRNRRRSPSDDPAPTTAFHAWIRDSLRDNKPYDQFVREVLTTTGEEVKAPPVVWFRELKEASALAEDTAQLFLGQRLGCARCHHHPFEKWSQQDYYGFAAFFSRVEVSDPPPPKKGKGKVTPPKVPASVTFKSGVSEAKNPRTGLLVKPTGLGGKPLLVDSGEDPRGRLVDWMTERDNPYFARALVNRYWKHFFGRGLVDPEDDLRMTNPPTNPELLDALAKHFVESKYDLKRLIRTLCTSRVYQLSAIPNAHNVADRQNFSRFIPRRLSAEVLLDAIDEVTLSRTTFKGAPAGIRAVQLPDNRTDSYFLSVFGRPDSSSACECERSSDASLAQALHMVNSQEVLAKVAGGRATRLAADRRPHPERLRELYLIALGREPSKEELETLLAHLDRKKSNLKGAYEDILWALVNGKEFGFNH